MGPQLMITGPAAVRILRTQQSVLLQARALGEVPYKQLCVNIPVRHLQCLHLRGKYLQAGIRVREPSPELTSSGRSSIGSTHRACTGESPRMHLQTVSILVRLTPYGRVTKLCPSVTSNGKASGVMLSKSVCVYICTYKRPLPTYLISAVEAARIRTYICILYMWCARTCGITHRSKQSHATERPERVTETVVGMPPALSADISRCVPHAGTTGASRLGLSWRSPVRAGCALRASAADRLSWPFPHRLGRHTTTDWSFSPPRMRAFSCQEGGQRTHWPRTGRPELTRGRRVCRLDCSFDTSGLMFGKRSCLTGPRQTEMTGTSEQFL